MKNNSGKQIMHRKLKPGLVHAMLLVVTVALANVAMGIVPVRASEDGHKKGGLFPLGDKVEVEALKDEYVPFKTLGDIPLRPKLSVELGDPFLDTGNLSPGFEVPLIGAIWQPRLWVYSILRTTYQTFDNGANNGQRETEVAARLDTFINLQLTGTEKIVLGLRPLDQNSPRNFTRYTYSGAREGSNDELNLDVETFFFEGDIGSLFPKLDRDGIKPVDFGFTIGRQPITFQEGILINDTIDAIGFVRNNLVYPGTSNFRVSGMWGWNRLDRNDPSRSSDSDMFGLFIAADAAVSTYNVDLIYVDDSSGDGNSGDGFYVGLSSIQRIRSLGNLSTAFRLNSSFALDQEIPGVIGDGTLLTAEFSKTPHGSDDIAYFNVYAAFGNYTQAGREAVVGGPLGNTGILFASASLSLYGAEINPFTNDDVWGFALGYQAFYDNKRRNLVLELATKQAEANLNDSIGIGFQVQQAVGQHVQLQFEGFYVDNSQQRDGSGGRAEVLVVF